MPAGRPKSVPEVPLEVKPTLEAITEAAQLVLDAIRLKVRQIHSTPLRYKSVSVKDLRDLQAALREALDFASYLETLKKAQVQNIPTEELLARLQLLLPKAQPNA